MTVYRSVMVVVVAGVLVISGCSNGGSSANSSSTSSSTKSSSSSSTSSSSSGGSLPSQAKAQSAMLAAADVTGFQLTDGQFKPPSTSQPLPCGQPDPDSQFPPTMQVGSEIDSASPQATIVETLDFYPDAATAQRAFQAGVQGVSCSSGNVSDGTQSIPVQLQTPSDVTTSVGGDKAIQVQLSSAQFQAVVTAATKDNAIVTFQYQTTPDADTSKLPNPTQLAALGVQKIATVLG